MARLSDVTYVKDIFDLYADGFEGHLVDGELYLMEKVDVEPGLR